MGTSTDGILAYGYDLGGPDEGWNIRFAGVEDEYENPDWYDDENEEGDGFGEVAMKRLLAAVGFTETDWRAEGYRERLRAAEAAVGVTFEAHCSGDYPMHLITAKVFTARRGHAKEVDFTLPDNADERLAWALDVLGIDVDDKKPAWLLASYWG